MSSTRPRASRPIAAVLERCGCCDQTFAPRQEIIRMLCTSVPYLPRRLSKSSQSRSMSATGGTESSRRSNASTARSFDRRGLLTCSAVLISDTLVR